MQPELFLFGSPVHAWGLLLGLGLAMAMWTAAGRLASIGVEPSIIFHIGALSLIGGVLGARLWGIVEYGAHTDAQVSFGGYLAGVAAVLIFVKLRLPDRPVMQVGDVLAPSVLVGAAFGRLGCFLNGCCYGGTSDGWGMRPPGTVAGPDGALLPVPLEQFVGGLDLARPAAQAMLAERSFGVLHPAPLYASLAAFAIYLLLDRWWLPRKRFHGEVTLAMCVLYGTARFLTELPRVDTAPGPSGLVSGQISALTLVMVSLPLLVYNRSRAVAGDQG